MLGKVSASMIFNFWTGMRMSRCILSCRYVAEKDCLALLQTEQQIRLCFPKRSEPPDCCSSLAVFLFLRQMDGHHPLIV
jgi:hypothetical protein